MPSGSRPCFALLQHPGGAPLTRPVTPGDVGKPRVSLEIRRIAR